MTVKVKNAKDLWHECLGYGCNEVQWGNYRLDKRVAGLYMKWKLGRGLISVEECLTTVRRGLYDYLKESKRDMLSRALKENVIEEGETKEEFTKRKRDERKKTLHEGK